MDLWPDFDFSVEADLDVSGCQRRDSTASTVSTTVGEGDVDTDVDADGDADSDVGRGWWDVVRRWWIRRGWRMRRVVRRGLGVFVGGQRELRL